MKLDQIAEVGLSEFTAGTSLLAALLTVLACAAPFIFY